MLLKTLSISIYLFLFLACKATAIVIKINDKDSKSEQVIHMATGNLVEFNFHQFSINGINYQYLASSQLSALGIRDDEKISFETSSGNKTTLDIYIGQRLLKLLSVGWQSVIDFEQHQSIPFGYGINIPPCSYIMYYLRFNYACFKNLTPGVKALIYYNQALTSIIDHLNIGDIILFKNKKSSYDKDAIMFIGNSLFLSWDNYYQRFYFRSSTQLDNDFFSENRQILKVVSVWPGEIPKPEEILTVFNAWTNFQKNKSKSEDEDENERKIRFSAESTPLSPDNLPSYIK